MKRLFDLFFSFLGLICLAPLFLFLIVAIRLTSSGPAIFVQQRVGQGGREFLMFKFRSMVTGAANKGGLLTVGADPRITSIGQILRRLKLDELPQLVNVLLGDMSLVGPRPEVKKYVDMYSESQRQVLALKPGITDPASFAFFDESELLSRAADPEIFYREKLMVEKIRINLQYAHRANLITDTVLIVATLARAFGFRPDVFDWFQIQKPIF